MNKSFLVLIILFSSYFISAQLNFEPKYYQYSSGGLNSESGADFIDYDGDGQLDVLTGYEQRSKFLLFKNVGSTFDINVVSDSVGGYCYIKRVDLNRDGFDDFLVAEKKTITSTYDLFLYTNDGSYNYTPSFVYSLGSERIERIDTADLNQDGDVDLIIDRFSNANFFTVANNLGNGAFSTSQISFVGQPSELYGVVDMNGDGFPDVVGAHYSFSVTDWIVVVVETDTSLNPPYIIHNIDTIEASREGVVANFSGTSLPDIMVSPIDFTGTGSTDCLYYENTGNFNFNAATKPQVNGGAKLYLPNDYDNDGDMDVLAHNFGTMQVLVNMGNGVFAVNPIASNTSIPVAWEDVNSDGLNDLLCSFRGTGSILTQNTTGAYNTYWHNNQTASENLMLFDADQNGKIDIMGTSNKRFYNSAQTLNSYILNTEVYEPTGLANTSGSSYLDAIYFDKENDGDLDILTSKQGGLYWLTNNNATFIGSAITPTINSPKVFREGDFDGDSNKDILLIGGGSIQYMEWNGSTFSQSATGIFTNQYAVGDVDVDGDEDFLYTDYNSATTSVDVLVGSNNGSGTFTSQFLVNLGSMVNFSSTNIESTMEAGDIDSDGDMDFFLLSYTQGKIILLRNDSNNVITPSIFSDTIASPNKLLVVDLDADGDNDVIATSRTIDGIVFYENDGNQNFTSSLLTQETQGARGIEVLDFDKDGDLDVFILSHYLLLRNMAINCPSNFSFSNDSLCAGDSLLVNGAYLKPPFMYADSLINTLGCDSINTIMVSAIKPTIGTSQQATICKGDSVLFGNTYLTTAGVYQDVLQTQNGCDSINSLQLTLFTTPNVLLQKDTNDLYISATFSNYQWYFNNTALLGETNDSINAALYGNGLYYLSFTDNNGCSVGTDTLNFTLDDVSLAEALNQLIKIYPNPSKGIVHIQLGALTNQVEGLKVQSQSGKIVAPSRYIVQNEPGRIKLNLSKLPKGIYVITLKVGEETLSEKVVLQ